MEVAEQTFYRWKEKFLGMGVAEVRHLKVLEEENRKLKQLVAELSLEGYRLRNGHTDAPRLRRPRKRPCNQPMPRKPCLTSATRSSPVDMRVRPIQ